MNWGCMGGVQHHTWLVNRVAPNAFHPTFGAVPTWAGGDTIAFDLELGQTRYDSLGLGPGVPVCLRLTLRLRQMTQPAARRLSITSGSLESGLQVSDQMPKSGVLC